MNNRGDANMIKLFTTLVITLRTWVFKPKFTFLIMNNPLFSKIIHTKRYNIPTWPPCMHSTNNAERTIKTFKIGS